MQDHRPSVGPGHVTRKLEGVFFEQHRFIDDREQARLEGILRQRGLDPAGLKSWGGYVGECFVSRGQAGAAAAELCQIVPSRGAGRNLREGSVPAPHDRMS